MRLVVMQFVTVDGVCQGPGAPDEDRSDGFAAGGWLVPYIEEQFLTHIGTWVAPADAFLFGRRTYEAFARDWPQQTDPGDPFATALNGLPKYVASRTLRTASWSPTTIISGELDGAVSGLKDQAGREIQVHGSARLAQALLSLGLVDELRLVIAPVVLGEGRRLFADVTRPLGLQLEQSERTPTGVTLQTYTHRGAPTFGHYGAESVSA